MKQLLFKILPYFCALFFLFLIAATINKYQEDIRFYLLDKLVSKGSSSGEPVLRPCVVRDLPFNSLEVLPKHWKYYGISDAIGMKAGHFESSEKDFKIYYQETTMNKVEQLRSNKAAIGWYQAFSFENNIIQCFRVKKTVFITIINKEAFFKNAVKYYKSTLYGKPHSKADNPIRAVDFYSTVKKEEDIAYVIELVARHWEKIVNGGLKANKNAH
jgi:hypothetical protein